MEHTVYFDDITLIPLPDDIVTNGNFANDLTSWSTWTENGSTYSVDAGEQCFVTNIPTTLPNPWSAQNITPQFPAIFEIDYIRVYQ